MPVLVNSETGEAQDLPQDQADIGLTTGTHKLPLYDPQGNPVMASLDEAKASLGQGYSEPTPSQLQNLLDQTKYGTATEQIKTGLEGAASAATFGLSTGAERVLGAKPEDIQKRREINPNIYTTGQLGGLAASSLIPVVGEANVLSSAGKAAAAGLGLSEAAGIAKVGSMAAKMATESALFQLGDEASKMFSSDPNQSAETALTDIGLAGAIGLGGGAALGAVSPLWAAASETRLGKLLSDIKDRANGLVKNSPTPQIEQMIEKSGIEVPGVVRAALGDSTDVRTMFQTLQESTTGSGKTAQEALQSFKSQANRQLVNALGKTPEQVDALSGLSDFDAGSELKQKISDEIKNTVSPLAEKFNEVKAKFADTPFTDVDQAKLSNDLAEINGKYAVSPSSQEFQKINGIIKEIPNIKTLEDLRNFQSVHLGDIANKQLWSISSPVKTAMRDIEENALLKKLGEEAPELQTMHKEARSQYRAAMETIDSLNDRLHVGKYSGPDSFLHSLNEMKPEDLLRRMTPKNDAGLLQLTAEKLPQTSQAIRESYLNQALKVAGQKAYPGEAINPNTFFSVLDKWSPQLQQFSMSPEMADKVKAIRGLLEAIPYKMNTSGTAKTLDSLWSKIPAGVGGMASLLAGHNPASGILLGMLSKWAARDVPDAIKLATLKYLGSGQPINSKAYKAMVDFSASVIKGESALNKATKDIFKSGSVMAPSKYIESGKKKEKLDAKIKDLQTNNSELMDLGGHTGYYLPEHTSSLSASVMRGVNYLNTMRPLPQKLGPLDPELPPSQAEVTKYDKIFNVVSRPLVALENVKNGTITQDEVVALTTVYPGLYQRMSQKITNEMIEHVSKGNIVPYAQRLNLSLFLGQPLDSTMTSQAIMASQPLPMPATPQQGKPQKKGSMKNINKISELSQTKGQAREARQLTRA